MRSTLERGPIARKTETDGERDNGRRHHAVELEILLEILGGTDDSPRTRFFGRPTTCRTTGIRRVKSRRADEMSRI